MKLEHPLDGIPIPSPTPTWQKQILEALRSGRMTMQLFPRRCGKTFITQAMLEQTGTYWANQYWSEGLAKQLKPKHKEQKSMAYNDIYFPVELQPVRFEGFTDGEMESQTLFADDFVSVVRLDTNKVLAVHKSGYKLIKNEDLFPIFEEAIEKSNIDHRGMMVKDEVANSGAKVLRTYRFPKHRISLGSRPDGKADEIDLTITLRNSYDGVWSFGYSMGAFRQICTNGMIIGNKFLDVKSKHTKHMDISPYVASLETAAVLYLEEVDNWRKWREITVSSAKAKDFLETQKHLTQKIRDDIYGLFIDDSRREGASAWAFFNAMTNWSTHAKVRKDAVDNAPAVRVGREDIVRKMLTSKEWKELVNELL